MSLTGGSVKRSLAMAMFACGTTIAKTFGLDAATRWTATFWLCTHLSPHQWAQETPSMGSSKP